MNNPNALSLNGLNWSTKYVFNPIRLYKLVILLGLKHMRSLAGPDAQVNFTHLSHPSSQALSAVFSQEGPGNNAAQTSAYQIGVMDLMNKCSVPKSRVCLLDPKAEKALNPEDGDAFDWFLFGVCRKLFSLSNSKVLTISVKGILGESESADKDNMRAGHHVHKFSCAHHR